MLRRTPLVRNTPMPRATKPLAQQTPKARATRQQVQKACPLGPHALLAAPRNS